MKTFCRSLVVSLFLCTGCVTLPEVKKEPPAKPAKVVEMSKPRRVPTYVTPEQVNEANAREMGRALAEELDRAQGLGKPGKDE